MDLFQDMAKSASAWFVLLCIASSHGNMDRNNLGTREYCSADIFFEPRCESSEVIFLTSAQYGRMRKGRCITDDLGSIGCAVDALGFLDSQCSGRRSCHVAIPKLEQHITSNCPDGLKIYLEVQYECVGVAYPPRGYCETNGPTDIGNQRGYLSNLVAKETGCGSANSPWRINAQSGQQFRIRLWNFNYASHDTHTDNCDPSVSINEGKQMVGHTICAEGKRESSMYTSHTNEMELRLGTNAHQDRYIVVEYEAFGCANRGPPDNGWLRRGGERLTLGCNGTSEHVSQWEMECNGTHWIGEEQDCLPVRITSTPIIVPEKPRTQSPTYKPSSIGLESTMSILVISGLAVLVCLCIVLSCMAVYIVRYRKHTRSVPDKDSDYGYNSHNGRAHIASRHSLEENDAEGGTSIETDDYWTWQKSQRGPLGNSGLDNNRSLPGTIASRASHQCRVPEESTMLVRKPDDGKRRFGTGRKTADYDKLDPNFIEHSGANEDLKRDCTA